MAFLNPVNVVEKFDLLPGMKVADFGCGSGHFTIEMAKRVGGEGVVYALDVQPEALEAVKSRAEMFHLSNVEIVRADLEVVGGSGLIDNLVDFVLVSNMLFQAENKDAVAKECFRILKSGREAAVIEWRKGVNKMGPPENLRMFGEEVVRLFEGVGFVKDREFDAGENHYGIVFIKSRNH